MIEFLQMAGITAVALLGITFLFSGVVHLAMYSGKDRHKEH